MAKFIDVHHGMTGITDEQFTQAHAADLAIQSEEGVTFEHAWADPDEGVVYCLSFVAAHPAWPGPMNEQQSSGIGTVRWLIAYLSTQRRESRQTLLDRTAEGPQRSEHTPSEAHPERQPESSEAH